MKKRRIMTIILMVIMLINISAIQAFADYNYVYVTRDMAWPAKGFNYKDIIQLYEPSNYGGRAIGEFVFVDNSIMQITALYRDSKNRISAFDAIDRYGNTHWLSNSMNNSNYETVTKINPNLSNSNLGTVSNVPNTFTQNYLDNIEAQGWELVHEHAQISTYNVPDSSTYVTKEIKYSWPFSAEWTTNNSNRSDIFGPGILNLEIVQYTRSASNYVNYGRVGSYNPKLYEHKILLYGSPSDFSVYATSKTEISPREFDIPVGKSFSIRFAKWTTNEYKYYVRIYRRYKGEAAAVQSVSVTQTGGNSFTAVANITNPGLPEADEHGHVWSTSTSNLTFELAPYRTKLGYRETTGQYSSNITDCLPGVTYYVRPYVINELGVSYGATQTFKINTPPMVTITEPTVDQVLHKGNNISIKANVSDGEGDNITYNIQIGTTAGASNLYNGTPNGTKTNTLVTHSYNTSSLPLTWNASTNRYEQKVYIRLTANDGKHEGETVKDIACIVVNYKPSISLTAGKNISNYGEMIELTGKVYDSYGGQLTISATMGGKSTSTTLTTSPTTQPSADNYSLKWQGTNVPEDGEYTNIIITVADTHGGSSTVTLSKFTITDILSMIKNRIQEHIFLDSGSDLRFLIIDTDTKITESQRNNELLEQIRSMIKNRGTHLFFIGNDNDTKNYIQRYLKDLN
ncbi:hypothetical protein [Geosporobacter ferrireducens]|uniref:Fibronectin type-III domain-containing protein n=1 Tax=Geosporobacter ferrireducens TaxID=1424294 RepID=A0A1D8GBP9_9FIRM|nr:hypothetical protein [Geosporobacter ferrireducens]AOT68341.1 hypothetical protein Gferi_01275 [Geosporobacter ferrireducens]